MPTNKKNWKFLEIPSLNIQNFVFICRYTFQFSTLFNRYKMSIRNLIKKVYYLNLYVSFLIVRSSKQRQWHLEKTLGAKENTSTCYVDTVYLIFKGVDATKGKLREDRCNHIPETSRKRKLNFMLFVYKGHLYI